MTNQITYKINSITNKLNPRFNFIDFAFVIDSSFLKSLFNALFSTEKLQIQFYNFQEEDVQNQLRTEQNNKDKSILSVLNSFDSVLLPRKFKMYR